MTRPAVFLSLFCALAAPLHAQLSPEQELAALRTPADVELCVFASEPMITNPAAIDVDTHGRVWVAEIQGYRRDAKNPPAEKIKVLEDTDGDGRADRVTVFADDAFAPMSICVAGSKVFIATSPDLWVYEDANGDLQADGPPKKLLTGFGGFNHDHSAHSLALGPDHKWWMSHGDSGFDVRGTDGSQIKYQWGAVVRGELDGSKLEVVAQNFRNPYEVCVNSFGESFLSDNDNDGNFSVRICWLMDGGDYGWFGRPPGARGSVAESIPFSEHWHFRGHIPGFVPGTLVTGFGSPCGICFYEGDAFGPRYKNMPWHADAGPREVRVYPHELSGAGMKARSETIISSQGDDYFRPDDVCAAPDGSLFVSDWYDGGVGGHAYNNPDQGRVFRLVPKGRKLQRADKPGPYETVGDAIAGLKSPNLATQFLAREKLLASGEASMSALKALLDEADPNYGARALWVLDRIGGAARTIVLARLEHADSAQRALSARILRRHGGEYSDDILRLAADSSPEVRREVLLALPNFKGEAADKALLQLAASYDGTDRYLLEAIHIAAGDRKARLYEELRRAGHVSRQNIAMLQVLDPAAASRLIAEQLASATTDADRDALLNTLGVSAAKPALDAVVALAGDEQANESARHKALSLLSANLVATWSEHRADERLTSMLRKLLGNPTWQSDALKVVAAGEMRPLGEDVVAIAASAGTTMDTRRLALAVATQLRAPGAAAAMRQFLRQDDPGLRQLALEALVELQDWSALREQLTATDAKPATLDQVLSRMMGNTGGALVLLRWIDSGAFSDALKAKVVARAIQHPDANIRVLYEKYIPIEQRPQRLGEAIQAEQILALTGDPQRGAKVYQSSAAQCANCHRVKGFGKEFGPELTQIGKKYERAALLETILNPSKAIAPEFVPYVVETEDGLVYAGFLMERSEREVVIKDINNKLIRVRGKDVAAIEPLQKSLMPELVLRDVTAQDAADLLAYLKTLTEPLAPAK